MRQVSGAFDQGLLVAVKGVRVGQKGHGAPAHLLLLVLQHLVHDLNGGEVGITQFFERLQATSLLPQPAQRRDEVIGFAPQGAGNVR